MFQKHLVWLLPVCAVVRELLLLLLWTVMWPVAKYNRVFPIVLAGLSTLLVGGCMTTSGFETGRTLPDGESATTSAVGVMTSSGSQYAHEHPGFGGQDEQATDPEMRLEQVPRSAFRTAYLVRYSRGFPGGFELDAALHSTWWLGPFGAGAGAGGGMRSQVIGDGESSFSTALALRLRGYLAGSQAGRRGFRTAQIDARVISSYHGEGWAVTLAPQVVPELMATVVELGEDDTDTVVGDAVLWGATLGGAWTNPDSKFFAETTVLVGSTDGLGWDDQGETSLLPGTDRHIRLMVGIGWRVGSEQGGK